ncbi:MAG: circadian clock KaiB family protein [Casimicrobiaceae bacterium]
MRSLTLYVAGDNAYSRQAQANLHAIIAASGVQVAVSVIDVLKHPELTLQKRIFTTPALIVTNDGGAESLIIGDLSEREKVARMLFDSRAGPL